jgi:chromosomal replication initiation ATPase DnaA
MFPESSDRDASLLSAAQGAPSEAFELAGRCRRLEALVAAAFAVPLCELRAPSRRTSQVAFARQCAIYLAHVCFGLSYRKVGRQFGRDHTTAAHACRLVERSRDEKELDGVLHALETACARLMQHETHAEVRA